LFEIVPGAKVKATKATKFTMPEKAVFLSGLKFYGIEKGYNPGWASNQYRRKFSVWPDPSIAGVAPRPPTMEVRQWIRSGQIAYALSKKRQASQIASIERFKT
jgi:hypothetical protein